MEVAMFWDISPCSLYMNHLQGEKSAKQETGVLAGGQRAGDGGGNSFKTLVPI
jgi:hypothetical protein